MLSPVHSFHWAVQPFILGGHEPPPGHPVLIRVQSPPCQASAEATPGPAICAARPRASLRPSTAGQRAASTADQGPSPSPRGRRHPRSGAARRWLIRLPAACGTTTWTFGAARSARGARPEEPAAAKLTRLPGRKCHHLIEQCYSRSLKEARKEHSLTHLSHGAEIFPIARGRTEARCSSAHGWRRNAELRYCEHQLLNADYSRNWRVSRCAAPACRKTSGRMPADHSAFRLANKLHHGGFYAVTTRCSANHHRLR